MTSKNRLTELTALENVLDTFGGDSGRWPATERERLLSFAASDRQARQLMREAEALDAVLAHAAGPPVGSTAALADRIAAAVANAAPGQPVRTERRQDDHDAAAGPSGVVIAWPRTEPGVAPPRAPTRITAFAGSTPLSERSTANWRTAALLAASLVAGVFVGVLDLVPADVAQLVAGADATPASVAFMNGEGLLEIIEEEFL